MLATIIYLILFCRSSNPAPLNLCLLDKFDSAKDTRLCPAERTALSIFYEAAKGGEWTESQNWLSQYSSHCDWHGVTCSGPIVTELNLTSNGLSGKLSAFIANLTSLIVLDVSDNDMKVRGSTLVVALFFFAFVSIEQCLDLFATW